jgi:hypothetical protein
MVSTVRKSHAIVPAAWERKNATQLWPPLLGAGPSRCTHRIARTDVGRYGDAEFAAFPDDPQVSPAAVLPGQPHDESDDVLGGTPVALPGLRAGLAPAYQFPMPAQQRGRGDQEQRPTLPRQQPRQRREQHPVSRPVAGPGDLPTQHHQLVAQDRDLHVLRIGSRTETGQAQNPPDDQETQRARNHAHHPASRHRD